MGINGNTPHRSQPFKYHIWLISLAWWRFTHLWLINWIKHIDFLWNLVLYVWQENESDPCCHQPHNLAFKLRWRQKKSGGGKTEGSSQKKKNIRKKKWGGGGGGNESQLLVHLHYGSFHFLSVTETSQTSGSIYWHEHTNKDEHTDI